MSDRFMSAQQKLDVISDIFTAQNIKIQDIYQRKNILSEIKYNIKRFIEHLKDRFDLVKEMLDLIIKLKESDMKDQKIKRYAYYSIQIINYDDDTLIQLFFYQSTNTVPVQSLKHNYHILNYFMEYLLHQDFHNEGSNNYFTKILNVIIDAKPQLFLGFLYENQHFCDKFILNLRSTCITSTLAKIIMIQNIECQQKFQKLIQRIFSQLTNFILKNLEDEQIIENVTVFLQQPIRILRLHHKINQIVYTRVKQLIRKLVTEFLNQFNSRQGNISNIGFILRYFFQRKKQSEIFENDEIVHEFQQWYRNPIQFIQLIKERYFETANNLGKIKYLEFLLEIVNFNSFQLNNDQIYIILQTFVLAFQQKNEGLVKIGMIEVFRIFCQKIKFSSLKNIQFLIEDFPKYFPIISNHLDLINLKMNPSISFQISILLKFNEKLPELKQILNTKFKINLTQVIDIHNIKLGEMIINAPPPSQTKIHQEVIETKNNYFETLNICMKKTESYQENSSSEFQIKKTISIECYDQIQQIKVIDYVDAPQKKDQSENSSSEFKPIQIINISQDQNQNLTNNQNKDLLILKKEENKEEANILIQTNIENIIILDNTIKKQQIQQCKILNLNEKIKQQQKLKQETNIIQEKNIQPKTQNQKKKNLSTVPCQEVLKFYSRIYKLI